jgi:hypothetical protein
MKFTKDDDLWEAEVYVPIFDVTVPLTVLGEDDQGPSSRQQEIVDSIAILPMSLLKTLKYRAYEYFARVRDEAGEAEFDPSIKKGTIQKHYRLKSTLVPKIKDSPTNYLFLTFDCDWEEEHGMQVVLADDQIVTCKECSTLAWGAAWKRVLALPNVESQIEYIRSIGSRR